MKNRYLTLEQCAYVGMMCIGIAMFIAVLFSMVGCKGPEASVKIITTVHHDTLITKEIHKDSVIHNVFSRDTIFMKESRLTVKYVYKGDSNAFIGGTVTPDTVVKIDTVKSTQTTIVKEVEKPLSGFDNFCRWIVIIALSGAALYFGVPALMKVLKIGI